MKYILVNYQYTPTWIHDYTDDYLIYDRSESDEWLKDFPKEKIIRTRNIGQVDYDRLSYLVDNYDTLPEVFVLAKSNLFKSITKEEFDAVKDNTVYTPLLTKDHKTYADRNGIVAYYQDGMYHERNDSWYVNELGYKYYPSFYEFAKAFHLPSPKYLPFAPGGNYILTREKVHKYGRDFYDDLRQLLPYAENPSEAHMIERSYHQIWGGL